MSELRVETISNNAGTGPVTLTGQAAAKAWVAATDAAILTDSYNISSGTDEGTGNYEYAFTNGFADADYCSPANGRTSGGTNLVFAISEAQTSSAFEIDVSNATPNLVDRPQQASCFGDLA